MLQSKWRFVWMFFTGIVISFVMRAILPLPPRFEIDSTRNILFSILQSIIITFLVWEGTLRFDHWVSKFWPWEKTFGKRFFLVMLGSMLICVASIMTVGAFFDTYICHFPLVKDPNIFYICLGIALNFSVMILFVEFGLQIFRKWKQSLVEIEQYKALTAQAKLENLQHQVNPHFLFNNMSVLTSLIYKDQDKAVDFVNQLSKVYRYLLDNKDNELVSVAQELAFIESYAYLLNIRYSPNLNVVLNIPDSSLQLHLPPLSVQLLLENAIKHNVVSTASPLTIEIRVEEEYLVVSNSKKLRKVTEESSKTGIQNIRDRYHFFSSKAVIVEDTETSFTVKIPLLKTL